MDTLAIVNLVLGIAGPLLAGLAHYRINRQPAPVTPANPFTPAGPAQPLTIGHGLLLEMFRQLLAGGLAAPVDPAVPVTPAPVAPAAPTVDIVALIEALLSGLVKIQTPATPAVPAPKS